MRVPTAWRSVPSQVGEAWVVVFVVANGALKDGPLAVVTPFIRIQFAISLSRGGPVSGVRGSTNPRLSPLPSPFPACPSMLFSSGRSLRQVSQRRGGQFGTMLLPSHHAAHTQRDDPG